MARTTGTSARIQRLTTLVATLLVALAIGFAFGRVFQGRWPTLVLLAAGGLAGVLAWALERRSILTSVAVSLAVLLWGLALLLFPDSTWYALPTSETLRAGLSAAAEVGEQARVQIAPSPPTDPLILASIVAVWAAVFSSHALAFRAGSPGLALVPPLALVAFADSVLDEFEKPIFGIWMLIAGLAILFADALRRIQGWGPVWGGVGRRDRLLPTAGFHARRLTAAVLAIVAVAPFIVPGFGSRAVIDVTDIGGARGQLSLLVSMASTLNGGEKRDLFSVRSEVDTYHRLTALERFDGVRWQPGPGQPIDVEPGGSLGAPDEAAETYRQEFTALEDFSVLDEAGLSYLPVGYVPSSVEVDADMRWEPGSQTLTIDGSLDEGSTYSVDAAYVAPTPADLGATLFASVDPRLTQIPDETPSQIRELAEDWVEEARADTDFERVMAIQEGLAGGDFGYDTDVAYREDSATIVEFLTTTRRGFCQQFATAMAVMLRSLGIPARVAVGFTPGQGLPDGTHRITTANLHSWVEVPFSGYGWLAFEPTPGRTNPTADSYLSEEATGCPSGRPCGRPGTSTTPVQGPTQAELCRRAAIDGRGLEGCQDFGSSPVEEAVLFVEPTPWLRYGLLAAISAALAALAAVPLLRAWRRRRRLRRAGSEPRELILVTYDVFTQQAAAAGLAKRPGETPEEYAARARASGRLGGSDLGRLTTLTVRAAYGRTAPTSEEAAAAQADAADASKTLRGNLSVRERLLGPYRRR